METAVISLFKLAFIHKPLKKTNADSMEWNEFESALYDIHGQYLGWWRLAETPHGIFILNALPEQDIRQGDE